MGKSKLEFIRPSAKYAPMPKEKRKGLFPRMGFCSTVPAGRMNDTIFLGNGSLTALLYGDPVSEKISFNHELL